MRQASEASSDASGASADAINNPVKRSYTRRETNTADMPTRAIPALDDIDDREPDIIVADDSMAQADYLAELQFMNEPVTIYLQRGNADNAPNFEMVSVNGRNKWVPVETPTMLARSYVEVLARAQRTNISTQSGEADGDQLTYNRIQRRGSSTVSFSVLEDKNPRGAEWLRKVMRES
jgi:hypothetical protein